MESFIIDNRTLLTDIKFDVVVTLSNLVPTTLDYTLILKAGVVELERINISGADGDQQIKVFSSDRTSVYDTTLTVTLAQGISDTLITENTFAYVVYVAPVTPCGTALPAETIDGNSISTDLGAIKAERLMQKNNVVILDNALMVVSQILEDAGAAKEPEDLLNSPSDISQRVIPNINRFEFTPIDTGVQAPVFSKAFIDTKNLVLARPSGNITDGNNNIFGTWTLNSINKTKPDIVDPNGSLLINGFMTSKAQLARTAEIVQWSQIPLKSNILPGTQTRSGTITIVPDCATFNSGCPYTYPSCKMRDPDCFIGQPRVYSNFTQGIENINNPIFGACAGAITDESISGYKITFLGDAVSALDVISGQDIGVLFSVVNNAGVYTVTFTANSCNDLTAFNIGDPIARIYNSDKVSIGEILYNGTDVHSLPAEAQRLFEREITTDGELILYFEFIGCNDNLPNSLFVI